MQRVGILVMNFKIYHWYRLMIGKSSRELVDWHAGFYLAGTRCIPIQAVAFPLHRQPCFMVEIVRVIVESMATRLPCNVDEWILRRWKFFLRLLTTFDLT